MVADRLDTRFVGTAAQVAEMREQGAFVEGAIACGHSVGEYTALACVSGVYELPALLDALLAHQDAGNTYELDSLFLLASTAALFSTSLKEKFLELLPNRIITDSIGSTPPARRMSSCC